MFNLNYIVNVAFTYASAGGYQTCSAGVLLVCPIARCASAVLHWYVEVHHCVKWK